MGIIMKDGIPYGNQPDVTGKVDKVTGKGLSTNDYTDADKEKLSNFHMDAMTMAEYEALPQSQKMDGNVRFITDRGADAVGAVVTGVKGDAESGYRTGNVNIGIENLAFANAGFHNSIYRGKNLGSGVTSAQWSAIGAGTFDDLFIGDYWVIDGVNWRIAGFDYYYRTGDSECTTHHVVIVPDTNLYSAQMNTENITTGAYVGSKMYTENLAQAKTTINNAFGSAHILTHRAYLQNATANGYASAGAWYDSTVELMTEQNVYGCKIFGNCLNGTNIPNSYTIDKSQYPLFALNPYMQSNRQWYWLRDVVSAATFATCGTNGNANDTAASNSGGVRPAFCIRA